MDKTMWCLETIVLINDSVQKRYDDGSNPLHGFSDAGVFIPQSIHLKERKSNGKKKKSIKSSRSSRSLGK